MSGYWTDDELARFVYFELDGARSPGVLYEVELGDGTPLKWDAQNGPALSGEFLRFMGLGLAEFTFKLRLVDGEDRAAKDGGEWRRASAPPRQGQPDRKRSIRHPILERADPAVSIVTLQAAPFEVPAEGGGVTLSYRFKAYRKPLPVTTSPKPPEAADDPKIPGRYDALFASAQADIAAQEALLEGSGIPRTANSSGISGLAGVVGGAAAGGGS